nr:hypothetical protein [Kovacikia minuta]
MSSTNPSLDFVLQRLRELRLLLLRLHKALLDSERAGYEQFYGPIRSNGELLQLVIGHEWFNWLHPISQFIVQIDELLSAKEPIQYDQAHDLWQQARLLLRPAEVGTPAEVRYYQAIQRDPGIALMHAEVSKLLTVEV